MRATLSCVALASGLALSACGMSAPAGYPDFAKTPAFRIEGVRTPVGGGVPQQVVIYRDGPKLRVETLVPQGGRTIVVFDQGTNDPYVLAPPAAPTPGTTNTAVQTTLPVAPPPNVAGRAIQMDEALAPQPLETSWAALGAANASNIGGCRIAGERGRQWRAVATSLAVSERTACITGDGIVLQVREGHQTIFQATRLSRGPQAASLFGVPPGYTKENPNAVAEGATTTTSNPANTGPAG